MAVALLAFVYCTAVFAQESEKQRVRFEARLTETGQVIERGLEWRIFNSGPQQDGSMPELAYSYGGSKVFDVSPGEYLVHVAYGHAGMVKKINVSDSSQTIDFILNAGGLKLLAVAAIDASIPERMLRFDVYEHQLRSNGERKLLAKDIKPGEVVAFPAGTYHVVSRFGDLNAEVRADLRVELGKLTEASLLHRAAIKTFRLVRTEGGDAIADTAWSILTESGDVIEESASAFPTMVLAEGNYTAIAKHNDAIYSQDFRVRSGFNGDVEVLALN